MRMYSLTFGFLFFDYFCVVIYKSKNKNTVFFTIFRHLRLYQVMFMYIYFFFRERTKKKRNERKRYVFIKSIFKVFLFYLISMWASWYNKSKALGRQELLHSFYTSKMHFNSLSSDTNKPGKKRGWGKTGMNTFF